MFYEELRFTRTGRVELYPNDASLVEYEMARRLELNRNASIVNDADDRQKDRTLTTNACGTRQVRFGG